jgi:HK97 family phage portal protein
MAIIGSTVIDFLGNVMLGPEPGAQGGEVLTLAEARERFDRSRALYDWMLVAEHTVVGYIIAGMQRSPIRIRGSGYAERDEAEWLWNVRPNPNQSHSEFVARLVDRMYFAPQRCALVVPHRGCLWLADGWTEEKTPGRPTRYANVSVEGSTEVVRRTLTADEVFVFRVPETSRWRSLMAAMGGAYAEMARSAADAFGDKNAERWLLEMDVSLSGTQTQQDKVNAYLKEAVGPFVKGSDAALPLYKGMQLKRAEADYSGGESTLDVVQIRQEAFQIVANCMRIPVSFLEGNVNNFETVFESFLAFCIDPVAKSIEDEIAAKSLTQGAWSAGASARVDTSHVRHVDLFAVADKVEKLVGSSIDTPNEIRTFTGQERVDAPGMDEYQMTKNHETATGGDSHANPASADAADGER